MDFKQLKQLLTEENAVSPVIGVILMVAITVILAAVIGTFVLGLGDNVQNSAPQANFQFEYSAATAGGDNKVVTITHNGGEDIASSSITVEADGSTVAAGTNWPTTVSTGDQFVSQDTAGNVVSGETIRIIWSSPAGGSSNTIGSSLVP